MNTRFPFTEALLQSPPFSQKPEHRQLFVESFREQAIHHTTHCGELGALWRDTGFRAEDIRSEEEIARSPFLMIHLFKEHNLLSCPEEEVVLTLTSSGTGGQKSQQRLDKETLKRIKDLVRKVYGALGLVSEKPANYLCFTYDPSVASDLGTAFSDEVITSFAPRQNVFYTFQWNAALGDFSFDERDVGQRLHAFAQESAPLRILGFPAFLHKILTEQDVRVQLPEGSLIILGGGWKGQADKEISKAEFRLLMEERLGIPAGQVRDSYGLVEHGIPYVDCEQGRLHIPNYARVFVRSPRTLEILPPGQPGLLQLACTYNTSYPCFNILTTDYGVLEPCDCGVGGMTLRILGRAGTTKHKGCAIKALDLIAKR